MQLFMATNDGLTPKHVAEGIGPMTRRARSTSWSTADSRTRCQERDEGAPLIRPDELRRLPDDEAIVLVRGADPIRVRSRAGQASRARLLPSRAPS
ncbi:MAG: type IV secretory system conjugative DNA transfer family protein [Paracoccaceae bacterium]